jgi:hypothetical protein
MFGDSNDAKGQPVRAGPLCCVDERDGGTSTSAVSRLIDNRLAIEPVQQVQRAVLSHRSMAIWAQAVLLGLFSGIA